MITFCRSSDEETVEEAPQAKVKKVSLRGDARNFTSIHAPSDKLIEQRRKTEEMTLADRLRKTKHEQVEHVKGERNKLTKKYSKQLIFRRKSIYTGEAAKNAR